MIIDNDVYLEHFGVRGMRWGQRKAARLERKMQRRAVNAEISDRSAELKSLRGSRRQDRIQRVRSAAPGVIAATAAIGASAVALSLRRHGNRPLTNIGETTQGFTNFLRDNPGINLVT